MLVTGNNRPIVCNPIPGFSDLTIIPVFPAQSVRELAPPVGTFFLSPTGSVHAVTANDPDRINVDTLRIGTDNKVRPAEIGHSTIVGPESSIVTYSLHNRERVPSLTEALRDPMARPVLSTFLSTQGILVPNGATCGRRREYSAYLSGLSPSMDGLVMAPEQPIDRSPFIQVTARFGGMEPAGRMGFHAFPVRETSPSTSGAHAVPTYRDSDSLSDTTLRPMAIQSFSASGNVRDFNDYLAMLTAVTRAAGLFNAIVQVRCGSGSA
jgi:hypothetical protein